MSESVCGEDARCVNCPLRQVGELTAISRIERKDDVLRGGFGEEREIRQCRHSRVCCCLDPVEIEALTLTCIRFLVDDSTGEFYFLEVK